jgi:hypothetical protein
MKKEKHQIVCVCNCNVYKFRYYKQGNCISVVSAPTSVVSYKNKGEMLDNMVTWGCGYCRNLFNEVVDCDFIDCNDCKVKFSCFTNRD